MHLSHLSSIPHTEKTIDHRIHLQTKTTHSTCQVGLAVTYTLTNKFV